MTNDHADNSAREEAWGHIVEALIEEGMPEITKLFEETLNVTLIQPTLLGITLMTTPSANISPSRATAPLSRYFDKQSQESLNPLLDAFTQGTIDRHSVFRAAYDKMVNWQYDGLSQEGSFTITDQRTTLHFTEKTFRYAVETEDANSNPSELESEILKIKEKLRISHFLYVPGMRYDPWRTVIAFGLQATDVFKFSFASVARACKELHRVVRRLEGKESKPHSDVFRMELSKIIDAHDLRNAELAMAIKISPTSFSNKKSGVGGRYFTEMEQYALVKHLISIEKKKSIAIRWEHYELMQIIHSKLLRGSK